MFLFVVLVYIGEMCIGDGCVFVIEFFLGFQIEVVMVFFGCGVVEFMGVLIVVVYGLLMFVVCSVGFVICSVEESCVEIEWLVDMVVVMGWVFVWLMVCWCDVVVDDDFWWFEFIVMFGGVQVMFFFFEDDLDDGFVVIGFLGWYGLLVGDFVFDFFWLFVVFDVVDDVYVVYV